MLAQEEVTYLAERRQHGEISDVSVVSSYEIHNDSATHTVDSQHKSESENIEWVVQNGSIAVPHTINEIDTRLQEFVWLLHDKDKLIEQKSQTISMLQHKVGTLEQQLSTTIALPDHTKEKQDILLEKEKIAAMHDQATQHLAKEKNKNTIFMMIMAVLIAVVIFVIAQTRQTLF